jgi:hypothetical protein
MNSPEAVLCPLLKGHIRTNGFLRPSDLPPLNGYTSQWGSGLYSEAEQNEIEDAAYEVVDLAYGLLGE